MADLEGVIAEMVGIEARLEENRRQLVRATDTLAGIANRDEVQRLHKIITRLGDLLWDLGWGLPASRRDAQVRFRDLLKIAIEQVDAGQTDARGHYQHHSPEEIARARSAGS